MYYTSKHEWIEYSGFTALVGITKIKLTGINHIQSAAFCDVLSHMQQGAVIATFHSSHQSIEVYMPVDGKIIDFNKKLLENPSKILSEDLESIWIVKISPNAPYKREQLLQAHQYKSREKNGNVKAHG